MEIRIRLKRQWSHTHLVWLNPGMFVVTDEFDVRAYNVAQQEQIMTCHLNRHAARIKNNCDDAHLDIHRHLLAEQWINSDGARVWADKMRPRYMNKEEVIHIYLLKNITNVFQKIYDFYQKLYLFRPVNIMVQTVSRSF